MLSVENVGGCMWGGGMGAAGIQVVSKYVSDGTGIFRMSEGSVIMGTLQ